MFSSSRHSAGVWLWVVNRAGFTTPGLEGAECDRAGQGGAERLRQPVVVFMGAGDARDFCLYYMCVFFAGQFEGELASALVE